MSSYYFTGEWSKELQNTMRGLISEKWISMEGEALDNDFMEYIMVKIKL
jgi:hypothetical protein